MSSHNSESNLPPSAGASPCSGAGKAIGPGKISGKLVSSMGEDTPVQDNEAIQRACKESEKDGICLEVGADAPPKADGYQVERRLGQGAFGEVWKARHEGTQVEVAIKFFRHHAAGQWQMLIQETRKLALLQADPRIVHLHNIEPNASPPYFVMDFIECGSLAGLLAERKRLKPHRALALFRSIVDAMAYVHAKGIRHCDIKPGNILIDAAGRPKIADFGQAMLSFEPSASALGTFFYMAPDQAASENQIPDARWDVYGLGALFYRMVTGVPPHDDPSFKAELEKTASLPHRLARYRLWVASRPVPSIHRALKGMDAALADIIDRCLAINPAHRPRDAGAILDALDERERQQQLRPIRIFGVLAPLLLIAIIACMAFSFFFPYVKAARKTIRDATMASHETVAQVTADFVEARLQRLKHTVGLFAKSDRFRDPIKKLLVEKSLDNGRKAVEERLEKFAIFEDLADAFLVCDAKGAIQASYSRNDAQYPELYGKDRSFRDYFSRMGERPPTEGPYSYRQNTEIIKNKEGKHVKETGTPIEVDAPYFSQPFKSTARGDMSAIAISAPIYPLNYEATEHHPPGPEDLIGVLVAIINLDELHLWFDAFEQHHDGAVVILDKAGHCVHHREKEYYEPRAEALKTYKDIAKLVGELPEDKQVLVPKDGHHVDPFDGRSYLAVYAPVRPFGWTLIIQRRADIVNNEMDALSNILNWWTIAAVVVGGVLLSGFWGWLLYLLRGKARGPMGLLAADPTSSSP